jgi:P4 family phage/plasmid primase-like protien
MASQLTYQFHEGHARKFLSYIIDPAYCSEIRILNACYDRSNRGAIIKATEYARSFGGWYNVIQSAIADLRLAHFVSPYITINPCDKDLVARRDNQLAAHLKNQATKDENIKCLRWLLIDVDSDRLDDTSATTDELGAAVGVRDHILDTHPEFRDCSLWGKSGNGGFILLRLPDYPNDAEHELLTKQALYILAAQFGGKDDEEKKSTFIDKKTHNPSRIMCVPGAQKCKGSHTDDRPYRLATLDGIGSRVGGYASDESAIPIDLAGWLLVQPQWSNIDELMAGTERRKRAVIIKQTRKIPAIEGTINPAEAVENQEQYDIVARRAAGYLAKMDPAISGQGGHDQTYDAACVLIKGCNLSIAEALPILSQYNQRCEPPWNQDELLHKLESAAGSGDDKPRGYLLRQWAAEDPAAMMAAGILARNEEVAKALGVPSPAPSPELPTATAGLTVTQRYPLTDLGNSKRLVAAHGHEVRWCEVWKSWLVYDGTKWREDLSLAVERMANEVPRQVLLETPPEEAEAKAHKDWAKTSQSIERRRATIAGVKSFVAVMPDHLDRDPWLLNCQNGTLNLKTLEFRDHRAEDMHFKVAPVIYDPSAECPKFTTFLHEIMNGDVQTVESIQRAFGYSITGITREHKFYVMYGVGRNGKGTLLRCITEILGDYANEIDASALMNSQEKNHFSTLTQLEGKRFIVAEETEDDARLAESMTKKLTGDNILSVRHLYGKFYTFKPSHHIFLATNHLPDVRGVDLALWSRLRVIPFRISYDDSAAGCKPPNTSLKYELRREYSGILNWLVQGCRMWDEGGLYDSPAIIKTMNQYRSDQDTIGLYIKECCIVGDADTCFLNDIYANYVSWMDLSGYKALGRKKFNQILTDKGFRTFETQNMIVKESIRLKTSVELAEEVRLACDPHTPPF